jgi:hypothetical protein
MGISNQAARNLIYKSLQTVRQQLLTVTSVLTLAGEIFTSQLPGLMVVFGYLLS